MAACGLLRILAVASVAQALVAPRAAAPQRAAATARRALDPTLVVANAEEALGGVVGFLPFIAIPGVLVGIPFLVYQRLASLEGDDYTDTVFTTRDPPRRGAPVDRRRDEELSYSELEAKYGEPTLKKEMGLMTPEPEPEPAGFSLPAFSLPEFSNPFEAPPPPPEEPAAAEPEYEEVPFKFPWE
mmetsp:Transcript_29062/g.89881  ORF Transcript_29062/g.89881 Transcript_29062/m.89881 type:complete len:185 (+) Transcript_29062:123-677(+)